MDLKTTPLIDEHRRLNAKLAPFGGWLMPIQYEGILAEHAHTRQGVCVFDICHMGEFLLEGEAVSSGLDRIVTQNISSMPVGACRYGFMLNESGGIIDDLVVYRIKTNNWMLVVNAATIAVDEANFKKYLSASGRLENVSDRTAKLDVQGPLSLVVLKDIFGDGLSKLSYYTFSDFVFEKECCIISRTGYTGELGFEVYLPSRLAVKLWVRLLKDPRVKPAGLGCRDTLRLEMGYPLYGQDIDTVHTPLAAGLERFVDFSKDFIGKAVLLEERKRGPKERLVCFKASSRRSPRHGFGIYSGSSSVGIVASGSFSPSLSVGIGMGYVRADLGIGAELLVKDGSTEIPVTIVKKPIYSKTSA